MKTSSNRSGSKGFWTQDPTDTRSSHSLTRSVSIASFFRLSPKDLRLQSPKQESKQGKLAKEICEAQISTNCKTKETKKSEKSGDKSDSDGGRLSTIFQRIGSLRSRNRSTVLESTETKDSNGLTRTGKMVNGNHIFNRNSAMRSSALWKGQGHYSSPNLEEETSEFQPGEDDQKRSDDSDEYLAEVNSFTSKGSEFISRRSLNFWRSFSRKRRLNRVGKPLFDPSNLVEAQTRLSFLRPENKNFETELGILSIIRNLQLQMDLQQDLESLSPHQRATRPLFDYIDGLCLLYKFNMAHGHLTEAAFALCAHAQLCTSDREIRFGKNDDEGVQRRRNELLHRAVELFDRAGMWEDAIAVSECLAKCYKLEFKYLELSEVLQKQAKFYRKILREFRREPKYYAFEFLGIDYPEFMRNQTFVLRIADQKETLPLGQKFREEFDFTDRMNICWERDDFGSNEGEKSRYFKVTELKPITQSPFENRNDRDIPFVVENYHRHNNTDRFAVLFSESDDIETILLTESKLPGMSRWSMVKKCAK